MTTSLPKMLEQHQKPIDPHDTMGSAGKKILLQEFIQMLKNEDGSRSGEDIEHVHDMRVATRKMRSAFRIFRDNYKSKSTRTYQAELKTIANLLGQVRDLDVMLVSVEPYQDSLPETISRLNASRDKARKQLNKYLDSSAYQTFVADYAEFLTDEAASILEIDKSQVTPYQVRHVLPSLVHQQLAQVRSYDDAVNVGEVVTLHALRIEFKRLRYLVTFFSPILGKSIESFINDLKAIQDHLGNLNDAVVAQEAIQSLRRSKKTPKGERKLLKGYLQTLKEQESELVTSFVDVWEDFNRRVVQRRLSDSLLVLR